MIDDDEPNETPLPKLPPRTAESHKGDYGRALLIGGSRGMAGAIALSGMSCLRGGAGLVQLATAESMLPVVAAFEPSYMTAALPEDAKGMLNATVKQVQPLVARATAVAIGPGVGRSPALDRLVYWLYDRAEQPVVLDADALNALAARGEEDFPAQPPPGPRILTPHLGEFARLLHVETSALGDNSHRLAREYAARRQVVLVLKGHRTLVTDGLRAAFNNTGNPGMATGGSGDVLTGLITALLCQGLSAFDAARLGVHLHGLAGDFAAGRLGEVSLTARDIVRYLSRAFRHMSIQQEDVPF